MKLLQKNNHAVLIFGLGVVGWSIYEHIEKDFDVIGSDKLDWKSLENCRKQIETFLTGSLLSNTETVDVIWSAGNTLFSVDEEGASSDLKFFKSITNVLGESLSRVLPDARKRYVLISSAGGLFEGQTGITSSSIPGPQRPYGKLKLEQETSIENQDWIDEYAIVRLSSVYSISNLRSRMGLIPTMVNKAIRQEFLSIYGTEMTLRDYVLDEDVGRYIAKILRGILPHKVYVANGKPHSILEIKNIVESITNRKVYLQYLCDRTNTLNMSFSEPWRARNFKSSDAKVNIKKLYYNIVSGSTL